MSNNPTYTDVPITAVIPENGVHYPVAQAIYVQNSEEDERMLLINTYQYGRTIKILVTIDAFFIFLNLFTTFSIIYLIPLAMIYFGYYGATYYKRSYINSYICYLFLSVFANMFYILYIINNRSRLMNNPEITQNSLIINGSFSFINLLVNSWIIKICYSFKRLLTEVKQKNLIDNLTSANNAFLHESTWNRRYLA